MLYIVEAIIVGIYCGFLYGFLSSIIDHFLLLLFVLGFVKHFMGYYLNLHSIYCKYGEACERSFERVKPVDIKKLAYESFLEGILFFIFGYFLSMFSKDRLQNVVIIGFLLHMISENIGLHKEFCNTRCKKRSIKNDKIPLFEPTLFTESIIKIK